MNEKLWTYLVLSLVGWASVCLALFGIFLQNWTPAPEAAATVTAAAAAPAPAVEVSTGMSLEAALAAAVPPGDQRAALAVLESSVDPRASNGLLWILRSSDPALRSRAARALGGRAQAGNVPYLLAALDDAETDVRAAAVEAAAALARLPGVPPLVAAHRPASPAGWEALAALGARSGVSVAGPPAWLSAPATAAFAPASSAPADSPAAS